MIDKIMNYTPVLGAISIYNSASEPLMESHFRENKTLVKTRAKIYFAQAEGAFSREKMEKWTVKAKMAEKRLKEIENELSKLQVEAAINSATPLAYYAVSAINPLAANGIYGLAEIAKQINSSLHSEKKEGFFSFVKNSVVKAGVAIGMTAAQNAAFAGATALARTALLV